MTALPPDREAFGPSAGWQHGVIRASRAGSAAAPSLSVIKFGGSLLARPDWPVLLQTLVAAGHPAARCLVVGGGAVVDGLRELDRTVPQSAHLMHGLAIEAMRLTARLVTAASGLPLVQVPPEEGTVAVLDVPAWLAGGSRAVGVPADWSVTSDSLAALVAATHGGSLLVAKSVPPPPCPGGDERVSALARAGWVDGHFPVAAAPLAAIGWAAPQA